MTTLSLVERIRHGLSDLVHRPADPDREHEWAQRESDIERERHDSVDSPVPGVRGSQPYEFPAHKRR